ncbi:MAG: hypothetical protein KDJ72_08795 [Methyloceanibacter sp.]|uniref:hypothetical protein n=1 Tax=Methyloceanibacter sp. TaxID=1965321 RepID=UPI001D522B10|nr:hypothetical protein [Methyloceanibacter sp.]MCB1443108.1 hypothetical protein [Methyloceanibacter sp.]
MSSASSLSSQKSPSALRDYWDSYGGLKALSKSPYLWVSVIFTLVLFPGWMRVEGREVIADVTVSVAPSLLGFSIGAMAIVLAFSGSSFFEVLSEKGRYDSAYIDLTSKFVHFILVQCFAIAFALFSKLQLDSVLLSFLATLTLAYALATAVATALALFGTARIYNTIMRLKANSGEKENVD